MDPLELEEPISEEKKGKEVALWEQEPLSQIPVKVLRGHTDCVTSCHFCFSDTRLLTSSHDKTAIFWVRANKEREIRPGLFNSCPGGTGFQHSLDVETGAQLMVLKGGHSAAITGCCLVPEMNRVVTCSWDKTVNAWDLETGKILWTAGQGGLLMSCSVSGDGKYVASASDTENALYINCADTGQRLHYMRGHHKSTVMSCQFDVQSQHLASVSADRSIKLWDLCSHKTTLTINSAHSNVISSCCFTRNGRYLCTASWDRTLQLWDVQTGSFRTKGGVQLSEGHDGSISSCAFSSDASVLVSGAYDRTVTLWDIKGLCKTLVLKGHSDWVMDVDISADKHWLVSSSKDSTVRVWNIKRSERIPAATENRKAQGIGFQILKCEECGRSFSVSLENSGLISKCVFCRLKAPDRFLPAPPCL